MDCELTSPCCSSYLLQLSREALRARQTAVKDHKQTEICRRAPRARNRSSGHHAFTVQSYKPEGRRRRVLQSGCVGVLLCAASTGSSCPRAAQPAELGETLQCADQRRVRCQSVGDRHHGKVALPGDCGRAGRCVRRGPDRHRDLQPAWRQVLEEFDSDGVELVLRESCHSARCTLMCCR